MKIDTHSQSIMLTIYSDDLNKAYINNDIMNGQYTHIDHQLSFTSIFFLVCHQKMSLKLSLHKNTLQSTPCQTKRDPRNVGIDGIFIKLYGRAAYEKNYGHSYNGGYYRNYSSITKQGHIKGFNIGDSNV